MGRLTLNILLSFAQFEREIIGERIRDKKLATARQGKYVGGQPVLGLDIVDRKYVVNEPEAELVRRIFHLLLEKESCRKVAEALNAEGLVTKQYETKTGKRMGGRPWGGRNVHNVVTDRKYIGKIVHKGTSYDGEHSAIVDAKLFDKVKRVLAANKTYTHKHQTKRFALLRRMIRCGHCGSMVMPSWSKNHGREYRYYVCRRRTQTGYVNCPLPSIPAAQLESAIVDQVREVLRHPEVIARALRAGDELGATQPTEVRASALRRVDPVWDVLYPEEQHRILTILIASVTVSTAGLKIVFRQNGDEQIVEELGESPGARQASGEEVASQEPSILTSRQEDGAVAVHVPMRLYRRNGSRRVITDNATKAEKKSDQEYDALVAAIAKAHRWQDQLEAGEHPSIEELAGAHEVHCSYARRLLRLTALAPEIVEAILTGRAPDGMSLRSLSNGIPHAWAEQRNCWSS